MKVLVTGGYGLVGSAIQEISFNYDYQFIFLKSSTCDLSNYQKTIDYFNLVKPDYVIHLAACVGGLFKNMNDKVGMFEKNMLINFNVVKASYEVKVKKMICCLSTCIFPDNTTYPINETMLHSGPPHFSNDAYAYAKRMLEVQCRAYNEQFNTNYVCVIPTNIYGFSDNFNLEDAHVIPALIHKCFIASKNNTPFIVAGSGKPLRQFIYSEDLANLIMWVLEKYESKEPIILSVNEKDEVSIGYIAKLIAKEFGIEDSLIFDTTKSDGQYKKTADNSKLVSLIGSDKLNFTPIEEGIKNTILWFIRNYRSIRK
jgi:GDP-L-fucose synthase